MTRARAALIDLGAPAAQETRRCLLRVVATSFDAFQPGPANATCESRPLAQSHSYAFRSCNAPLYNSFQSDPNCSQSATFNVSARSIAAASPR